MDSSYSPMRTPAEVAELLTNGVTKKKLEIKILNLLILGMLAGIYVGFGAIIATHASHDTAHYLGYGVAKLVAGVSFTIGLLLVIVAGGELFTGNTLMLMRVTDKKQGLKNMLSKWVIVYIANFTGAVLLAVLYYYTESWKTNESAVGTAALGIANAKVNLSFVVALTRGILANWFVCLAVYLALAAKDLTGKVVGMLFPIMSFVALGFEHSVANMYFIPIGLLLKGTEIGDNYSGDLSNLNIQNFLVDNLIPVTIGNIIGGALFVGLVYWFVYVKNGEKK